MAIKDREINLLDHDTFYPMYMRSKEFRKMFAEVIEHYAKADLKDYILTDAFDNDDILFENDNAILIVKYEDEYENQNSLDYYKNLIENAIKKHGKENTKLVIFSTKSDDDNAHVKIIVMDSDNLQEI